MLLIRILKIRYMFINFLFKFKLFPISNLNEDNKGYL